MNLEVSLRNEELASTLVNQTLITRRFSMQNWMNVQHSRVFSAFSYVNLATICSVLLGPSLGSLCLQYVCVSMCMRACVPGSLQL